MEIEKNAGGAANRMDHVGWLVLKFGGTSVSSRRNWQTIERIIRQRLAAGNRVMIVCSAISGLSDLLEKLIGAAVEDRHQEHLEQVRRRHLDLARELGLDGEAILGDDFHQLAQLTCGAALVKEVSPRLKARVMAYGELMSTRLGAALLIAKGLDAHWHDARETLMVEMESGEKSDSHFLSATCGYAADPNFQEKLSALGKPLVITQGFIARDRDGETVLLGRGGSDTSAAYFAAILQARELEIWTDVPGVFTANPKQVPEARLLRSLDYEEAQEITSMGAKVLHPRCLEPVRRGNIPLHVYSTERPGLSGTVVSATVKRADAQVKAISTKLDVTLISMESLGMWRRVGSLAEIFDCFKRHGVSIDLISTSETNVTVSLDKVNGSTKREHLNALLRDLGKFCTVREISPCASVSLVGRNIRRILHKLGPIFTVFEDMQVHMVTQAANDLNISFIVDEGAVDRLVAELHHILFETLTDQRVLGPTWLDIFHKSPVPAALQEQPWWAVRRAELLRLAAKETPLYVYDANTLRAQARAVLDMSAPGRVLYSIKANPHPDILRLFYGEGLGFECVSPGEIELLLRLFPEIDRRRILFTPNFVPRREYEQAFRDGVQVTLDNLFPLESWPEVFAGHDIFVRIDPGQGMGHHDFVKTAGSQSKFGVTLEQFRKLRKLAEENRTRIVGLHAHTGSGILTPDNWQRVGIFLADIAQKMPTVRILDLGGGLGVVEKPGQKALDLAQVNQGLSELKQAFPRFELWLEPGRYLVAKAGVLLAKVTQTKRKGDFRYIGVETGMNSIIRPALYGAYHRIVNLSGLEKNETMRASVVGPICETGDVLGHERRIAPAREGDVLLIDTAGAYGRAMSSTYNLRQPAREVMLEGR